MKLLIKVSSQNECADDPGACFLDLTPTLAAKMLARVERLIKAKQEDPETYEHYYFAWSGEEYHMMIEVEDRHGDEVDLCSNDYWELRDAFDPDQTVDGEPCEVECPQMEVREDGVSFIAIPRHCSWYIQTGSIPLEVIREAVKEVPCSTASNSQ